MRALILLLVAFTVGASAQCLCNYLKWATCDGTPCTCTVTVGNSTLQPINCNTLVSKCHLMRAEMYRLRSGKGGRFGGKPTEHALTDDDGIYDPECEQNGAFRPKQCNNTNQCWCVNSAGVRRSDLGDKQLKCETVETYWIRIDLKHRPVNGAPSVTDIKTAIETTLQRYNLNKTLIEKVDYDKDRRLIVVDIKKPIGDRTVDLSRVAYYLEKDIKNATLFMTDTPLVATVGGQPMTFERATVYYVDEKPPTFTMRRLTGGVIAVIVVVALAIIVGLLVLYLVRKREARKAQGH